MSIKPILFSTPMVQAILEGRKTQTRRVIHDAIAKWINIGINVGCSQANITPLTLAKYQPRDILYVREEYYQIGHWEPVDGVKTKSGRMKWRFVADNSEIRYCDNAPDSFRKGRHHKDPFTSTWHKRLARFMPKAAARILLEVIHVRAERLQDISEEDAIKEGIQYVVTGMINGYKDYSAIKTKSLIEAIVDNPIYSFQTLWTSTYGPESWDENPWVWVYEFKQIDKPVNF